jgi:hypothetical protein
MGGLLNYTTTIAAEKTAAEIQKALVKAGATKVMVDYRDGRPTALTFQIKTEFGERAFRLPVNPHPVQAVLSRQRSAGKIDRRYASAEQAERTAWRVALEWVQVQLAYIETGMVTADQILLPYMTTQDGGTVYEAFVAQQLALPATGGVVEAGADPAGR